LGPLLVLLDGLSITSYGVIWLTWYLMKCHVNWMIILLNLC